MIDVIQIWLDGLEYLPEGSFETGMHTPEFDQFSAEMEAHGAEIMARAEGIGCSAEAIEPLFVDRLDQLVANNSTAEFVLALLLAEQGATPEPPPTTSIEVDWTIETCEDAADVFIDRLQVLLLDEIAGMTIAEMEATEEPEFIIQFLEELTLLREEFLAIGCTEEQVNALVGERLDQLVPVGEAAEDLVASIRDAVAENELFSDLD